MKRPILYALLLLSLTGCQSDPTTGTTTVEGQVVDNQSRQGVLGGGLGQRGRRTGRAAAGVVIQLGARLFVIGS